MKLTDPNTFPDFQLCKTLEGRPRLLPEYVWEEKLDGARAMVSSHGIALRTIVVMGHDLRLRDGKGIPKGMLLDGEILNTDDQGFTAIQGRLLRGQWKKLVFIPFDVLYWENRSCRIAPFSERRQLLWQLDPGPKLLTEENEKGLPELQAVPMEWEGVIGKSLLEPYHVGKRRGWLKWKQSGIVKVLLIRFEEGDGAWKGLVGKVVFGVKVNGHVIELGKAGGLTTMQRWEFEHRGERYLGRTILIKHNGIVKHKFRNPIFEGFTE